MSRRMGPSETLMLALSNEYGFATEVPFGGLSGKRKWRWDAARDDVVVEYQGQGFGHHTAAGMARDAKKITEGQLRGMTVVICTSETVNDGSCLEYVEQAMWERGIVREDGDS